MECNGRGKNKSLKQLIFNIPGLQYMLCLKEAFIELRVISIYIILLLHAILDPLRANFKLNETIGNV